MNVPLNLKKGETIVTAFAETIRGSGFINSPVWVIIQDRDGNLRRECLQPSEQGPDTLALFRVSEAASKSMVAAVMYQYLQAYHKK